MEHMPDSYDLWERQDEEQERALEKLPVCSQCGDHIQQERAVCVDEKYICDNCLDDLRVELLCNDDW